MCRLHGILIPASEVFNIPTILDILHKKIRDRVKVTSPDIRASLKAKGCLSGSLFLASFLIGIEFISVFLLLHGFDSHEPIRRVEIAAILLIFDYIFADHLAGFVSVISASPKGLDKRSEEHTSELQSLMRTSYA